MRKKAIALILGILLCVTEGMTTPLLLYAAEEEMSLETEQNDTESAEQTDTEETEDIEDTEETRTEETESTEGTNIEETEDVGGIEETETEEIENAEGTEGIETEEIESTEDMERTETEETESTEDAMLSEDTETDEIGKNRLEKREALRMATDSTTISGASIGEIVTSSGNIDSSVTSGKITGAAISYKKLCTIKITGLKAGTGARDANQQLLKNVFNYIRDNQKQNLMYKVVIPAGTYYVGDSLCVYSNTWIDMTSGATIKKGYALGPLLRNDNGQTNFTSYNGASNIVLEGGVWDSNTDTYGEDYKLTPEEIAETGSDVLAYSTLRFGHASNIILKNTIVNGNVNGHHVEFCGVNGVGIVESTFKNYKGSVQKEAIQIDVVHGETGSPAFGNYDDTPTKNVVIYKSKFQNLSKGLGNHNAVFGIYYDDILIKNNTFSNIENQAIYAIGFRNSVIDGNVMTNVGQGVAYYSVREEFENPNKGKVSEIDSNIAMVVKNNNISTSVSGAVGSIEFGYGIVIYGDSLGGKTYPITNVTITDNTITAYDSAIYLYRTSDSTVSRNNIKKVSENSRNEGPTYGIFVNGKSCNNEISGNTIGNGNSSAIDGSAIQLYDNSTKNKVGNNVITKVKGHGINIGGKSQAALSKNTVSYCTNSGLHIYESSTATVSSDKYTKCTEHGVSVNDAAAALSGITADNNKKHGITIDNSQVEVYSSSAKNNAKTGINLISGSKNCVIGAKDKANVVTGNRVNGITISAKCKTGITVGYNTVNSNTGHGISLREGSKATISNNTVASNSKGGIYFNASSGQVRKNTVKSNKQYGIGIDGASKSCTIGGASKYANTISGNGTHGITVLGKSYSKLVISYNKIKSNKQSGINVGSGCAVIAENNTIQSNKLNGISIGSKSSRKSSLTQNTVSSNSGNGISIRDASLVQISKNTVEGNAKCGIIVTGKCTATITSNTIKSNKDVGVSISNNCKKNEVRKNKITGNKSYGISITSGSSQTIVKDNTLMNSGKKEINCGSSNSIKNGKSLSKLTVKGKVKTTTTKIKGNAQKGYKITAYVGKSSIGSVKAKKDAYTLKIKKQKKGTKITLKMTDANGNTATRTVTVK